jgi:DNA-binding transcriptional ArsR family regulator
MSNEPGDDDGGEETRPPSPNDLQEARAAIRRAFEEDEDGELQELLLRTHVEVGGEEVSLWSVANDVRLKEEYRREYRTLWKSVAEETKRGISIALLRAEPLFYDDLTEWTGTTRRTVRSHAYDLRDAGVLQVGGYPATVSFSNDDLRLLAANVIAQS